MLYKQRI